MSKADECQPKDQAEMICAALEYIITGGDFLMSKCTVQETVGITVVRK